MDIRLHPDYQSNGWIYFAYTGKPKKGTEGWNTSIMRAKLKDNTLVEKELLFEGIPALTTNYHFGCRITFDGKGHIFFGIGERGTMKKVHELTNDWGKIHRLNEDGSIPHDNPFVNTPGARQSIWSYGHRNPQGLVISPFDGTLWESEHGPKGGDDHKTGSGIRITYLTHKVPRSQDSESLQIVDTLFIKQVEFLLFSTC